jgi:two-component system, NarL family, sensor kinase
MGSRRRARVAAGLVFGVAATEVLASAAFGLLSPLSWSQLVDLLVVSNAILGLALAVAGWPIAAQRPRNLVGWALLLGGCAWASTGAGIALLAWADSHGFDGPFWRLVATATNGGWTWALTVCLPLALMLLPDGHLPGRRWRWALLPMTINGPLFAALGIMSGFSLAVGVPGYLDRPEVNASRWPTLSFSLTLLTYAIALLVLVVRFRRGSAQVRRQLSWVLLAVVIVISLGVLDPVLPDSIFTILPIALIPLSITVAVLRYQLFDIRFVLSRSVVYVVLTAAVIGAYAGIVALGGVLLPTRVGLGTALIATLLIAVAFHPVRVWLQRAVDRAIYGARQDPVRAVAAVGERLGEVGVVGGAGLDGVLEALVRVMRFPWAAVVVGGLEIASFGEPPASRHATPLLRGEETLGELVIGLRTGEARLSANDARVLELLAAPIAAAVQAATLAEELRRSREQVITGREEERRRLRRDLHDGLGPVLTGVVLNAEAALRLLTSDPARSADLLVELRRQTTGALEDIRRLVYDLRPPALDSLGLVEALREQAALLGRRDDAAPLQVNVEAPGELPELPAAVEVAAYRIVTEALTNVVRHSSASAANVKLSAAAGSLHVAIHDDGSNLESSWQPGVGLTSIRERAAELGGRCRIEHDRTGGRVDVELPLPQVSGVRRDGPVWEGTGLP